MRCEGRGSSSGKGVWVREGQGGGLGYSAAWDGSSGTGLCNVSMYGEKKAMAKGGRCELQVPGWQADSYNRFRPQKKIVPSNTGVSSNTHTVVLVYTARNSLSYSTTCIFITKGIIITPPPRPGVMLREPGNPRDT